jgi:hypothetical protein
MQDSVTRSWREFDQAVSMLPNSPDPHLGLARLYVYSYRDLDKAIDEWNKAEQRKYKLGPREIEQEADGFRLRAEKAMAEPHGHAAAQEDLAHAKGLYQSIHDYEGVAKRLQFVAQLEMALNPPPPSTPAVAKTTAKNPVKRVAARPARQPRRTQAWQSPKAGKRRKS